MNLLLYQKINYNPPKPSSVGYAFHATDLKVIVAVRIWNHWIATFAPDHKNKSSKFVSLYVKTAKTIHLPVWTLCQMVRERNSNVTSNSHRLGIPLGLQPSWICQLLLLLGCRSKWFDYKAFCSTEQHPFKKWLSTASATTWDPHRCWWPERSFLSIDGSRKVNS
jgi:hypothetical protein